MKLMKNIFAFLAVAAAALGCSGTVDENTMPELKASATEVDLANGGSVDFTVSYQGVDVTSESTVFMNGSAVPSVFTPSETGSYMFHAEYDGMQSNTVTVNVIDSDHKVESKYERHVCLMEFTGAWCLPCYHGFNNMMQILSKPSLAKYKDMIHIAAFHSNSGGTDVMAITDTDVLFKQIKGVAYPTFAVDMRDSGALTEDGKGLLQPALMTSFDEEPHCGIAVSSEMDAMKSEAVVTAKVASELTSEYRVVILVIEDKIVGSQKTTTYPEGQPDYIHKHVVRKVATSYSGTFTGEKLTDDGKINAGEEASKTWTVALDPAWKLEDTEIYALVLDNNGYVNNMNVCHIENGNTDYNIKKQ